MLRNSLLSGQATWLEQYRLGLRIMEQGRVRSVGDGVVWIEGLPSAAIEEVLLLEDGSRALVFHLAKERLGAILLTQTARLTAGTIAHLSGQGLGLPVGDTLIGRVINPLGDPLDGHPPLDSPNQREMF